MKPTQWQAEWSPFNCNLNEARSVTIWIKPTWWQSEWSLFSGNLNEAPSVATWMKPEKKKATSWTMMSLTTDSNSQVSGLFVMGLCHKNRINYQIYPKYWDTPTYYHTSKIWKKKVCSTTGWCVQNIAGWVANNVDSAQMLHCIVSDVGLHCLLRPVCPNT